MEVTQRSSRDPKAAHGTHATEQIRGVWGGICLYDQSGYGSLEEMLWIWCLQERKTVASN